VTGTAGIVQRDTKAANQCKAIETTPEQDRLMSEFMKMASQGTPSDYALFSRTCEIQFALGRARPWHG